MSKWFEEQGEHSDVVISSRVRLARNLVNYPFSTALAEESASLLCREVEQKLTGIHDEEGALLYGRLSEMSGLEREAFVERHILSPKIAGNQQEAGLFLSKNESQAIMVNEEDHIRIQALTGGMNMDAALQNANVLDDFLSGRLDIAFDEKYGYLTACPTNVGTGLRASYMMFLPALSAAGKMNQLNEEAAKCGIAIRGMYGEGTEALSGIYQISNQRTLGITEEDIIRSLNNVALQIIEQERAHRKYILINNFSHLEDQIYRSYGVLRYARRLNTKDAMTLLSQLMLGESIGLLKWKNPVSLFKLMMDIQPANLKLSSGKGAKVAERDAVRANYLNRSLPELDELG